MVAGGELGLRFGQIERGAVGFGIGRHQVDEEGYELKAAEDVPRKQAVGRLAFHDGAQVERSGAQHHAYQRKPQGKLVADHLGAGAQGPSSEYLLLDDQPARAIP